MSALLLYVLLAASAPPELVLQRDAYLQAEALIESRRFSRYQEMRPDLDEYPLAIYLDYQDLEARMSRVDGEQAQAFIATSENTPLALRFKDRYLRSQGKLRRWDNVLTVSPDRPNAIELQCYYFRAHNMRGDRDLAWDGAEELWQYGKSRPKACDPLFEEWLKAGQMTDDISWRRQLLAFDARRRGLMTYSAGKASEALEPWSERLLSAYLRPDRVQRLDLPVEDTRSRDVYVQALKRLARRDANRALAIWQAERDRYPFTNSQAEEIQDAIAWRAQFQDKADVQPWLDDYLAARGDEKLLEQRLRNAIAESDWASLEKLVVYLPPETQQDPVWQFWKGFAQRENGDESGARATWLPLASKREYYGFLAAEQLGQAYDLNHTPLPPIGDPQLLLEGSDALQRTEELMFHQRGRWATSEWRFMLPSLTETQQAQLAQYAVNRGWHRFAIDAAVAAGVWDALELRFPRAYELTFIEIGQQYSIPETELMAIARRESAFYPRAHSGAGARGLMQLLPSTARSVAPYKINDLSQQLFDVETNVALGGAYYRQLLDRYGNNRVLTLAAYNAGPHRVKRWLNKNPTLTAPQWVESLPYRETREYVKSVLAYNVVYRAMGNAPVSLFNKNELERRY